MDLPKTEQGTGHEGVPEKLVPSHVRLLAADPGDQLDGLLGSESVHDFWAERGGLRWKEWQCVMQLRI